MPFIRFLLLISLLILTDNAVTYPIYTANTYETVTDYIEQYQDIAVLEMQRTKIPASIILAQAIVESRFGNSRLATKAHNHFGIKCKNNWQGDSTLASDDAPNECFRKYNDAIASYIDHSFLLLDGDRYKNLFNLSPTNYQAWAKGLEKARYATDKKYASVLINVIKKHNLSKYDTKSVKHNNVSEVYKDILKIYINIYEKRPILKINYVVNKGDTLHALAQQFNTSVLSIKTHNHMQNNGLHEGQILQITVYE